MIRSDNTSLGNGASRTPSSVKDYKSVGDFVSRFRYIPDHLSLRLFDSLDLCLGMLFMFYLVLYSLLWVTIA